MKPASEGASIVLLGRFNPAILHPAWFASKGLIRDEESETATDVIVTSDVAQFRAGEWLHLQATAQRFIAQTKDPSQLSALRDLVVGLFSVLEHTPFERMGLNHLAHYRLPSEEAWHAFGDRLAPKGPWSGLFEGRVGLRSLTIEARRANCTAKYIRIKVEPSAEATPHGVFLEVNEHYERESPDASSQLLRALKDGWEAATDFASMASRRLLGQD
jgi:hypothetical protein